MNLTPEQSRRLGQYLGRYNPPKQKQPVDWCYWVFFLWLLATVAFFISLFVSFFCLTMGDFPRGVYPIDFDRRLVSSARFPKRHLLGEVAGHFLSLPDINKATANAFRRDVRMAVSDVPCPRPIAPVCSFTPVGTYEPDLTGVIQFMQGRTRGVPVAHNHVQPGATPGPATLPSCDGDRRTRTSLHCLGEITALTAG